MRTRSTTSSDETTFKPKDSEGQYPKMQKVLAEHSLSDAGKETSIENGSFHNRALSSSVADSEVLEVTPSVDQENEQKDIGIKPASPEEHDATSEEASSPPQPFVVPEPQDDEGSRNTHMDGNVEKSSSSNPGVSESDTKDEDDVSRSTKAKKAAMLSIFRPDPTTFFSGPLEKEFAKSFYKSLNMLASQAISNAKMEPNAARNPPSKPTPANNSSLQVPPRNESRSSVGSKNSYDAPQSGYSGSSEDLTAASPGGSELLHRPLPGISPKSLAEQLRNSDSASMVVSRQHKFAARNPGYSNTYSNSERDEASPNVYGSPNLAASSPRSSDYPPLPLSNQITPSTSLHHFTTRYTVEKPADPSRLGVELVLDNVNGEPVIEVECGGNRGLLYVNKLCQGSKGQSIHFNEEWLTPNEFQFISGRETAKDWKRSIRHCGKSLKTLMTKGILQVHPPICECLQCRDLHGSKLLPGKKLPLKSINRNIKIPSPYNDTNHSDGDEMTRHGYEGSLNSIISQLHKASGFEANTSPETLDLSSHSHCRRDTASPNSQSRKRSRDESERRTREDTDERRRSASPSPKRPYSRQEGYANNGINSNSSFTASYALMSPEDQYRHMLALMSRSLSPEEQQRHFLNLAQTMGNPLGLHSNNFTDYPGLPRSLNPADLFEKFKGKHRHGGDRSEDGFYPYELPTKMTRKPDVTPERRGHSSSTDKFSRFERGSLPPSRGDQKFIALESRHHDDRSGRSTREDVRSWTTSRHAAMIELNARQNMALERSMKCPWQTERIPSSRFRNDVKPNRNNKQNGTRHENMALDHAPISKTPVTTLHHRPQGNDAQIETPRRHQHSRNVPHRSHHEPGQNGSKYMPMLDLQKHAVPMLSLKRPTEENILHESTDGKANLNPDSDASSPIKRQSSSAPPPFISSEENKRAPTRPTSAQDRISTTMIEPFPVNASITNGITSNRHPPSPTSGCQSSNASFDNFFHKRSKEIQSALDRMKGWKNDDVCDFLQAIDPSIMAHIEEFKKHNIDGEGLPLLTDRHLMDIMNIKLGTALKIVSRVKRELTILPESVSCSQHWYMPSVRTTAQLLDGGESPKTSVKNEKR